MKTFKPIAPGFVYNCVIGTGGIGSGMFFAIEGNETLGRNESRMATLLPSKDYCKQHIILHYISRLMGSLPGSEFIVYPIGAVGQDETGSSLLKEMIEVGMDVSAVALSSSKSSMFSVCYQYPDHSGGNITTANSACDEVKPSDINKFFTAHRFTDKIKMVVLAVPEVPVETRIALLEHGRKLNGLTVASIASAEVHDFRNSGGFELTDLLSLNIDEARHVAEITGDAGYEYVARECMKRIHVLNPSASVIISSGKSGVYCCTANNKMIFLPSMQVPVSSTAGAGDALLAGIIAGIICGLPLTKGVGDTLFGESPLASALELGVVLASFSISSPHTIHPGANSDALLKFIKEHNLPMQPDFLSIFS